MEIVTGHLKSVRHRLNDDPTPTEVIIAPDLGPAVRIVDFSAMDHRMLIDDYRIVGLDVSGLDVLVGKPVRLLMQDGWPIKIEAA